MSALRPPRRGRPRAPPARLHTPFAPRPRARHHLPSACGVARLRATHTPAGRRSRLRLARHVKAVSSRSRRSHAVTDCSLRRLMVSDMPPRLRAALPRRQEANSLRNGIFLAAISANRKFLRNQVLDNQRSFKDSAAALRRPAHAHTPRPLASHMHHQSRSLPGRFCTRRRRFSGQTMRGRTTWTSRRPGGRRRRALRGPVLAHAQCMNPLCGAAGGAAAATARRRHADLRHAGAG